MATISARKRKDGTRYTAQIRIRRGGEVVYTESETFNKKRDAESWATQREAELNMPGELERARNAGVTVKQVLEWYLEDFDGKSKFGRSKLSTVNMLINRPEMAKLDAMRVTSGQLVKYIAGRRQEGAGPSTAGNDLIWMSNAFRSAAIGRDMPVNRQAVEDAQFLCRKEKLIGRAKERDRRPALEELDAILEWCNSRDGRAQIPMVEIVLFALFSSRRQDEICRIRWDDLDSGKRRVLVRDMKHPRELVDTWVFLPAEAWAVIQRQPKTDERIFPYDSKSVSAAFTRVCKMVGVDDLRFHDLRHECTSWLFETGLDIPRVAGVTGHKSWGSLQRYTHLQDHGQVDKYRNWTWRPAVAKG